MLSLFFIFTLVAALECFILDQAISAGLLAKIIFFKGIIFEIVDIYTNFNAAFFLDHMNSLTKGLTFASILLPLFICFVVCLLMYIQLYDRFMKYEGKNPLCKIFFICWYFICLFLKFYLGIPIVEISEYRRMLLKIISQIMIAVFENII